MANDQPVQHWFIDLEWLEQNNRSFLALAEGCLCPKCTKQLKKGKGEIPATDLIVTIKDCCSQKPGFIASRSPILESVFRLFLANGNQPLNLEELGRQLAERRGGDTQRTSAEVLSRLLRNERYYGLRLVQETLEGDV
jgi:hypothetical protein